MNPELEAKLKQLYYDPSTGLQTSEKFYQRLKSIPNFPKVTLAQVKVWVKKQVLDQRFHKRKIPRIAYYPIVADGPFARLQADFLDLTNDFPDQNRIGIPGTPPCRFLFTCVDVYTRYAWAIPCAQKDSSWSLKCLEIIHQDIIRLFGYDLGGEFLSDNEAAWTGAAFQTKLKEFNRHHIQVLDDYKRKGIVERFNRTIRGYIRKYCIAFHTDKWIDKLAQLMENYNNTIHGLTKVAPISAIKHNPHYQTKIEKQLQRAQALKHEREGLEVGDWVRHLVYDLKHKKNFRANNKEDASWSKEIYQISHIQRNKYFLKNKQDEGDKVFRKSELLKVNPEDVQRYEGVYDEKDHVDDVVEHRRNQNNLNRAAREVNAPNVAVLQAIADHRRSDRVAGVDRLYNEQPLTNARKRRRSNADAEDEDEKYESKYNGTEEKKQQTKKPAPIRIMLNHNFCYYRILDKKGNMKQCSKKPLSQTDLTANIVTEHPTWDWKTLGQFCSRHAKMVHDTGSNDATRQPGEAAIIHGDGFKNQKSRRRLLLQLAKHFLKR